MNAETLGTLFDYLFWSRDLVLDACDRLPEGEYARETDFTYKSIRGMLNHALAGEVLWGVRYRRQPVDAMGAIADINDAGLPTVASLRARWAEEEATQRAWLAHITDADLMTEIVYVQRDGLEVRQPALEQILNIYGHTIQHRSEAAEALTLAGCSPGSLDLQAYYRLKREAAAKARA